jgi:hypothetical protein
MLRKRLLRQTDVVAAGEDPLGIIRDPQLNHRVYLPLVPVSPAKPEAAAPPFTFLAGQPAEVRVAFERAWRQCALHALEHSEP